jgi:Zn-dependent protease with chaperone function
LAHLSNQELETNMGQTAAFLALFWSAMSMADRLEAKRGPKSRLWLALVLPALLTGMLLVGRLVAALVEPARRLLRRPSNPWQARVMSSWLATLASAPGVGRAVPALVTLGGDTTRFSNAAARGVGLGMADSVWVFGRVGALPEDQLQAVLAHELGHLRLRHFIVLGFAIGLLAAILPPLGRKATGRRLASLGTMAALFVGAALCAALSRRLEDGADDFAAAAGHGPGLLSFFATAQDWKTEATELARGRASRWRRVGLSTDSRLARVGELSERIFASHRPLAERAARLSDAPSA